MEQLIALGIYNDRCIMMEKLIVSKLLIIMHKEILSLSENILIVDSFLNVAFTIKLLLGRN